MKVAIVDKYPRGTNYSKLFPGLEFDEYHLTGKSVKKLLKKDIDIQIDKDAYEFIITVGADATKFFAPRATVSSHQGYLVEEKFLPIIDPAMLVFKPQMQGAVDKAAENILEYIAGTKKESVVKNCVPIQDTKDAVDLLTKILSLSSRPVALDTETSALYARDGHVLGISIAYDTDTGYYLSADIFDDFCSSLLQEIVCKHLIVFHNAKFDMHMLAYHFGINFDLARTTEVGGFEDTMAMHYILDESQGTHGLKDLAIKYTDLGDYDRELDDFKRSYCANRSNQTKLSEFTYDLIPFDIMYKYAAMDTIATLLLYEKFKDLINKNPKLIKSYTMIKQGIKFLVSVEDNGVPFSRKRLVVVQEELQKDIFELEEKMYQYPEVVKLESILETKFNPNSVVQLRYLFYSLMDLQKVQKKTDTGEWSMDAEVLEELAKQHPIAELVNEYKKAKKIKSTYIDKIIIGLNSDSRLRTFYNLTTTTSGRLSSSGKLNMQQLPRKDKRVKWCIKAPENYVIVSQDLGTAEMYVAAVLSGDKNLMQVFIDKQAGKGADFHSSIAHMVFDLPCDVTDVQKLFPNERQAAKAISFGILYGSGPQKVADTVNAEGGNFTLDDANQAISVYFKKFPKLKKWLTSNQNFIKENGYIYSIFGRKRRLGNVFSNDRQVQGHEVRSGINFLVQSVASDINLIAGINLQEYIMRSGMRAEIFGLVHDSILAVVHKDDLEDYLEKAKAMVQADMGVSIPGCPIAVDQEVGGDYSFQDELDAAA